MRGYFRVPFGVLRVILAQTHDPPLPPFFREGVLRGPFGERGRGFAHAGYFFVEKRIFAYFSVSWGGF